MVSNYEFHWDKVAERQLDKLSDDVRSRIIRYMNEAIERTSDPKDRGKALTGNLVGYWCYRIGSWRVICDINETALVVTGREIIHRSTDYKNLHFLKT